MMLPLALATHWVIAAVTFLAAIAFTLAWLKTGRKLLLAGVGVAVVAGAGVLLIEALIVTDRERVETEIYDVAKDVEQNDLAAVLEHMHPQAEQLKREAESRLPDFKFSSVVVNLRRVEIHEESSPRTASAYFIVTPSGTHKSTQQPIPRNARPYLKVELVEQGDRWLLHSYEVRNFMEAFQRKEANQRP